MGPIERELREKANGFRCRTGEAGESYEFWPGLATWALGAVAAGFLLECAGKCDTGNDVDAWSEAIEAAEALGL